MAQSIISIVLFVTLSWTGGIKGRVVDARTGKPLAGAVVLIVDGEQGSKTNEFGYFNIRTVLPGDYDLICGFPEYRKATIKGIVIRMDTIPQVFFALRRTTDVVDTGFFAFPPPPVIDSTSSPNVRSARPDTLD